MEIFKGSGVAIVTPFTNDGSVDYNTLKTLINFQIENATDAIIICGTTGESATLSDDEHLKCIETCVEEVNGRIPVIAGTGSNCTKTAIEISKKAEKLGVDGLLIVTPYYNKTTQKGLIEHYSKIADNVNTPIILYNVPSRTGINIEPTTLKKITDSNPNIIGIKEASGNISQIAEEKAIIPNLNLYSGNDDQTVPILSLGGIGVISVIANILPYNMHKLVENYLQGNIEISKREQLRMLNLCKKLFVETNPIPIKHAMELMGLCNSATRLPLTSIEEDHKKQLIKTMKEYGINIK